MLEIEELAKGEGCTVEPTACLGVKKHQSLCLEHDTV